MGAPAPHAAATDVAKPVCAVIGIGPERSGSRAPLRGRPSGRAEPRGLLGFRAFQNSSGQFSEQDTWGGRQMSLSSQAMTWALVISLATFSSATAITTREVLAAKSAQQTCPPFERKAFLTKEPLQVNPGGKCPYQRFTFEFHLSNFPSKPPETCYFARVVGSDKQYGPFCSKGENFGMQLPRPIEWLWSSTPVTVYITLCGSRSDCR